MVRRSLSMSLVVWVGLACPLVCGASVQFGRGTQADEGTVEIRDCCGHPVPASQLPGEPGRPVERRDGSCFCLGLYIVSSKAAVSDTLAPVMTDEVIVASDWRTAEALTCGSPMIDLHGPPAVERTTPLLI